MTERRDDSTVAALTRPGGSSVAEPGGGSGVRPAGLSTLVSARRVSWH